MDPLGTSVSLNLASQRQALWHERRKYNHSGFGWGSISLPVFPRCDQRGEDDPGVWRAPQSHQCGRDSAADKKQRQLPNGGQPEQHQGTQEHKHKLQSSCGWTCLSFPGLMAVCLCHLYSRTFQSPRWRTSLKPWKKTRTSKSSAWQQHGVTTRSLWWEGVACGLRLASLTRANSMFTSYGFISSSQVFGDMLRENKTLQSLNLETNFITGAGVQALVDALRDNDTLTEIKIDNQVPVALMKIFMKFTEFLWNEGLWYGVFCIYLCFIKGQCSWSQGKLFWMKWFHRVQCSTNAQTTSGKKHGSRVSTSREEVILLPRGQVSDIRTFH